MRTLASRNNHSMRDAAAARIWFPTIIASLLGGIATLAVAFSPVLHFAYRSPIGHTALDSIEATIGLIAAYLLFTRGGPSKTWHDMGVTMAIGLLVITNLLFSVLPLALHEPPPHTFSTWAPLLGRMVGTVILAASAFSPDRKMSTPVGPGVALVAALATISLFVALIILALQTSLPSVVTVSIEPEASVRPQIGGHLLVVVAQGFQALLFAIAAAGFGRRARRTRDPLMGWLAAACVMGGWARLVYLMFPSLYSEWLYMGDFLRLSSNIFLLIGIGTVIRDYWTGLARVAVTEERRRVARDLHDGLAQELAFIVTHSKRVKRQTVDSLSGLEAISGAAERALAESRRAVTALSETSEQRLSDAIIETVEELGHHMDVILEMEIDGDVELPDRSREHLLRIVREAVWNAMRHGRANTISVTLREDGTRRLVVADDGCGFDPTSPVRRGFGLTSMKERAAAMGGALKLESRPGAGTRVEIELP